MTHAVGAKAAHPTPEHIERRQCLRLLSTLARPGAVLLLSENPEDPVAIVSSRTERGQRLGAFAVAEMEAVISRGWAEPASDGWGWKIARAGLAVVREARTSDAAARAAAPARGGDRPVARTPADSGITATRHAGGSLAWLHNRRDKDGQPLISAEQLAAGERLAGDLWRARMTPRVTAVWTGMPGDGSGRRSAPGVGVDIADTVIAAKVRVELALKAVGPELAGPLIDVCGHMLGLDDIERVNGLPMRSGKLMLRTALTQLARHYGYLPPEHGEAEIARRIAGWMAEDGRATLDVWQRDGASMRRGAVGKARGK